MIMEKKKLCAYFRVNNGEITMKVCDWTIQEYEQAIMKKMSKDYKWYTLDMLKKIDKVTIKSISDLAGSCKNPKTVVNKCVKNIQQNIEWCPYLYLKEIDTYHVLFEPQTVAGAWNLEKYSFTKYEGNIYISSVQAGDRVSGAGRNFYIPPRYMQGHSYKEFLEGYFSDIANPGTFGLSVGKLIDNESLKTFLGFE